MRRFNLRVAGGTPTRVEPQTNLDWMDEHLALENRVYTLEKEIQILSNVIALGVMVAAYFAFQWYQKNVNSIPGVIS